MPKTKKSTIKKTRKKLPSAKTTTGKKKKKESKKVAPQKKIKKVKEKKEVVKPSVKRKRPSRYFEAVGRRKTAVARVRLWTQGKQEFLVNDKPYQDYFSSFKLQQVALDSLRKMKCLDKFKVKVLVKGSGLCSQAEAVRHGISRALVKFNPDFKKRLRRAGFLTRDPRMRERKKFGLKRARRAPQWRKR